MVWYAGTNRCRDARAFAPLAFTWPLTQVHSGSDTRANVYAGDGKVTLLVQVPGRTAQDVDLRVDGERLTLVLPELAPPAGVPSSRTEREIPRGAVERTFTLPWKIAADDVRASLTHGVLRVELSRAPEAEPRRIAVHTN